METTKSADGTVIAYDRTGDGPPLVVAVGAFCDRRSFVPPDHGVPPEVIAPVLTEFFLGAAA